MYLNEIYDKSMLSLKVKKIFCGYHFRHESLLEANLIGFIFVQDIMKVLQIFFKDIPSITYRHHMFTITLT